MVAARGVAAAGLLLRWSVCLGVAPRPVAQEEAVAEAGEVSTEVLCGAGASDATHKRAGMQREHMLMSHRSVRHTSDSEDGLDCTHEGYDPYRFGFLRECCEGLKRELGEWDGRRQYYRCLRDKSGSSTTPEPQPANSITCTEKGGDPWATGRLVLCCRGLDKTLVPHEGSPWTYRCDEQRTDEFPEGAVKLRVMEWNVNSENADVKQVASVVAHQEDVPDVVGLCELTAPVGDMATALREATSREFQVQPGRADWEGFGTDIFFDAGKFKALEGGVSKARCASRDGQRAVNVVVLEELVSGAQLIVGGTQLSYCYGSCDLTHRCELSALYDQLLAMKDKYPKAPVVWMGDMNRDRDDRMLKTAREGHVGSRQTFELDDLSFTDWNTHYNGGPAIDHIFGERGTLLLGPHGRTEQGVTGFRLGGSDHFPITAVLAIRV